MSRIKRFKSIINFGVFKNYVWDVIDKNGNILYFKNVNIIYGRNYSGKTTLSRILQSFERKHLPTKFENPEFEIELDDGTVLTQDHISANSLSVRVFNEDFISKHFRFFVDPNGAIEPFAVLGQNVQLEEEIKRLEKELGNEEPVPTGLYKELKEKERVKDEKEKVFRKAYKNFEESLRRKAIDRRIGIKYHPKFGDPSYDIKKLRRDIKRVISGTVSIISDEEKEKLEELLKEEPKEEIPPLQPINLNFEILKDDVKRLVEQKVVKADKIEELVKDAILNRWVKEGKKLHEERNLKVCAFCGSPISDSRWEKLEKHYDNESEKLEKEIQKTIEEIDAKIEQIKHGFRVNENLFYAVFREEIHNLILEYEKKSQLFVNELKKLKRQLEKRKEDIINEKEFIDVRDFTDQLREIFSRYENLRQKSNEYAANLQKEQARAKEKLRLREIADFINEIDYESKISEVHEMKEEWVKAKDEYDKVEEEIKKIKEQIENLKRSMKNEEEAVKKVNQYLNRYLGHPHLSLRAIEEDDEINQNKKVKFMVFRDEDVAFNLSEGEKNLIAFCYFIAKLHEIGTVPEQTIIWIDDPVSSLDSNHIFFIYSLIEAEIVKKNRYQQLFITTHNLNFLKYLLRIKEDKIYFIIEKRNGFSVLKKMPKYMKNYVTEFIYLFEQIYRCANENQSDENYYLFWNFGNNARKFLEIYLFYKYPGIESEEEKLKLFFGDDIPTYLTNRLINEMSHLAGTLERGEHPVEYEEVKKDAKKILERLKVVDCKQYVSLLRSIGVEENGCSN